MCILLYNTKELIFINIDKDTITKEYLIPSQSHTLPYNTRMRTRTHTYTHSLFYRITRYIRDSAFAVITCMQLVSC